MRRLFVSIVVAAFMAACSDGSGTTVSMNGGHSYEPSSRTVTVGEAVTWRNDSAEAHTVTAYEDDLPEGAPYFASGDFDSEQAARDDLATGLLEQGDTYEVTFDEPGTYRYFCIPHEQDGMKGTIVVQQP